MSYPRRTVVRVRTTTDLRPTQGRFRVVSEFEPAGDQPAAITSLAERVNAGDEHTVLLGARGRWSQPGSGAVVASAYDVAEQNDSPRGADVRGASERPVVAEECAAAA